jgi:hypothetical protein
MKNQENDKKSTRKCVFLWHFGGSQKKKLFFFKPPQHVETSLSSIHNIVLAWETYLTIFKSS